MRLPQHLRSRFIPGLHAGALVSLCLAAAGCAASPPPQPSIEITRVPPFGTGDSIRMDDIEGRVRGVLPGQRVVLYARAGDWWIQPTTSHPFTEVSAESRWKNRTHPGLAYAALLITANFRPPNRTAALPQVGRDVLAITTTEGSGSAADSVNDPYAKKVMFAGYEWRARQGWADPGGTRNIYDPANVWTDENGALHLKIAGQPGHWTSAETALTRSLGYGSYRYVVRDVAHLEPGAVFTMQTIDETGPDRDMDIEVSEWGEPGFGNGQFVIQPYYVAANSFRFQIPSGLVTFQMRWDAGRSSFAAFSGPGLRNSPGSSQHVFTSGVPGAGREAVHLHLYVFDNPKAPVRHENEVIVEKFEYLP